MQNQIIHRKPPHPDQVAGENETLRAQLSPTETQGLFFMRERFLLPAGRSVSLGERGQVTLSVAEGEIILCAPDWVEPRIVQQGDVLHLPQMEQFVYENRTSRPARIVELVFSPDPAQSFSHVLAEEGRFLSVLTDIVGIKLSGKETGGAYVLMMWSVPPGGGPGLHTQSGQETFYIVQGQFRFRGLSAEQEAYELSAEPGDILHVPSRVFHAYRNSGSETGTMLVLTAPAGLTEQFFEQLGSPVANALAFPQHVTVPHPETLAALLQHYQVDFFLE